MFFEVEFLPEYSRNKNRVAVRYKRICKCVRLIRGGETSFTVGIGRKVRLWAAIRNVRRRSRSKCGEKTKNQKFANFFIKVVQNSLQ